MVKHQYSKVLSNYSQWLQSQRYSSQTVKAYSSLIKAFLQFSCKPPSELTQRDVDSFCYHNYYKGNFSISTQRQFIGALKLLLRLYALEINSDFNLVRPKKDRKLPQVLSLEEVSALLNSITNVKHKLAISILYGAGLRISELLKLRVSHINMYRKQIRIVNAKGRKDRFVTLPETVLPLLQAYLNQCNPACYLIESVPSRQYSASSIRKIIKRACTRCGIKKPVTPHTFRHSYATHLLESGIDIRYIQVLLGHSKPETTMIYTYVSSRHTMAIQSPLDQLYDHDIPDKRHQKVRLSEQFYGG